MASAIQLSGEVVINETAFNQTLRRLNRKPIRISVEDNASLPLGRIVGQTDKFDKAIGAATDRVVAFGAAASAFYAVQRSVVALVKSTVDVENSLARININLGESQSGLKRFGAQLFNIARNTGQTFDDAAKGAEELTRQGLGATETLKRLNDALILSRQTGLSAADSVEAITASINSFTKEALDSTQVINKLAAVDQRFAVSSKDLAEGIARAGSTAADAGVSFDELLGLITAVQQTTQRGGAVIGNSFKTFFAKLSDKSVLDNLEKIGVGVRDISGQALPATQILENLGRAYDGLSQAQKKIVNDNVGTLFQINSLKAALSDVGDQFGITARATDIANRATDQAIVKNEQLNKTLKASFNSLQQSVTQVLANLGNIKVGPLLDGIIKSVDSFAQTLGNSDTGVNAGKSIGESLLQGISNVLTGPGLVLLLQLFTKTALLIGKTVTGELASILKINNVKDERLVIENQINAALSLANKLEVEQFQNASGVAEQQKIILGIVERINVELQRAAVRRAALVDSLLISGALTGKSGAPKRAAGGILPAMAGERSSISRGVGGATPGAKPVLVPNFAFGGSRSGPVVANTSEYLVRNFAGGGDAIFNQDMVGKMGLPRGAVPLAEGFIPQGGFRPLTGKDLPFTSKKTIDTINDLLRNATLATSQAKFESSVSQVTSLGLGQKGGLSEAAKDRLLNETARLSTQRLVNQRKLAKAEEDELKSQELKAKLIKNQAQVARRNAAQRKLIVNKLPANLKINFGGSDISPETIAAFESGGVNSRLQPHVGNGVDTSRGAFHRSGGAAPGTFARTQEEGFLSSSGQKAFIFSILAPLLAGFVESSAQRLGVNTKGGTVGGQVTGGLSGALNLAGTGAAFGSLFGPEGGLIGGIGGGLIGGVGGILEKSRQSAEEFNSALEESAAAQNKNVDAVERFIQLDSKIKDLGVGASPKTVAKLAEEKARSLGDISDVNVRNRLAGGGLSPRQLQDVLNTVVEAQLRTEGQNTAARAGFRANNSSALESTGDFFNKHNILSTLISPFLLGLPALSRAGATDPFKSEGIANEFAKGLRDALTKDNAGLLSSKETQTFLNRLQSSQGDLSESDTKRLNDLIKSLGINAKAASDNFIPFVEGLKRGSAGFQALQKEQQNQEAKARETARKVGLQGAFRNASIFGEDTFSQLGLQKRFFREGGGAGNPITPDLKRENFLSFVDVFSKELGDKNAEQIFGTDEAKGFIEKERNKDELTKAYASIARFLKGLNPSGEYFDEGGAKAIPGAVDVGISALAKSKNPVDAFLGERLTNFLDTQKAAIGPKPKPVTYTTYAPSSINKPYGLNDITNMLDGRKSVLRGNLSTNFATNRYGDPFILPTKYDEAAGFNATIPPIQTSLTKQSIAIANNATAAGATTPPAFDAAGLEAALKPAMDTLKASQDAADKLSASVGKARMLEIDVNVQGLEDKTLEDRLKLLLTQIVGDEYAARIEKSVKAIANDLAGQKGKPNPPSSAQSTDSTAYFTAPPLGN